MNKTQQEYTPHDSDDISEGWAAVAEYSANAVLIAWDECHKIYLAMDEVEAKFYREASYTCTESNLDTIKDWWASSCLLRFVSASWSIVPQFESKFVSLISQWADEDDD